MLYGGKYDSGKEYEDWGLLSDVLCLVTAYQSFISRKSNKDKDMHFYCLFCRPQMTAAISAAIEKRVQISCFRSKIIQRYWKKGKQELRAHEYLPEYLFLCAEKRLEHPAEISKLEGVRRMVGRSEQGYELAGQDLAFAKLLYGMGGTLGILKTRSAGNHLQPDRRAYPGFDGKIIRLDRRKGRALLRFIFDGKVQTVWVGVDTE